MQINNPIVLAWLILPVPQCTALAPRVFPAHPWAAVTAARYKVYWQKNGTYVDISSCFIRTSSVC